MHMETIMNNFTLPTCVLALLLSACGSADRQPTPPVAEVVRTCESIRSDIIKLAGERGFTIVKIYEPTTIKTEPKKVSCTGRAVVGTGEEAKIYYRNYQDQEGDWLVQYSEVPLEK